MKSSALWCCSSSSLAFALLCSAGAASASDGPPHSSVVSVEDLRAALFAVSVNGAAAGEPIALLRATGGTLYAPEEVLRSLRLRAWQPALIYNGVPHYALDGVPGLELEIVESTQTILLTASPELLETTAVAIHSRDTVPMTPSATGGFLNYELVAQRASGRPSLNGLAEVGVFAAFGVGQSTFVGVWNDRDSDLTRLETNWTSTNPERMRFLRIGDTVSRSSLGGNPVRFAGVQLGRDFSTQPGFITMPLPTIGGETEVPSVVDVYVNNVLTGTRELPPGPFSIEHVPVVTGGGEVQLVVRDLLGRETLIRERYYTARRLLRRGLLDYSVEAGFLRQNFGKSSFDYGAPMGAGTFRYGISHGITGEVHIEASPDVRMGGVGASVAIGHLGVLNASTAVSQSDRGVGHRHEIGFEGRTPHLSYGAVAELISDDFVTVGTVGSDRRPPELAVQAFAGVPLEFGSFGVSYVRREARDQPDLEFLAANASIRLSRWGTLHLAGRKSLRGPAADTLLVSFTMPLAARLSASVGGELGEDDRLRMSLQKNLPAGEGMGFRAAARLGMIDRFDARLSYQTNFGTYDVDLSWVDAETGVRITASGGVGFMQDEIFASRKLTQSFATVKVGDYPGVRVYADNQEVGTTNVSGVAVIPRLRPFESNRVRLELSDLPIDAQIDTAERIVRPFDRSGVAVDFGVRPARGAIVTLVRDDGTPVPAGGSVRLRPSGEEFVVAPGGQAYLTGLDLTNRGVATWQNGACAFEVDYPEHAAPQPRLGPIACREDDL